MQYAYRYRVHRAKNVTGDDVAEEIPSDEVGAEDKLSLEADYDELRAALRLLPEKEKQLLMMKYHLNMSDEEIADVLGIKPQSVHVYVDRAKKLAKRILNEIRQDDNK